MTLWNDLKKCGIKVKKTDWTIHPNIFTIQLNDSRDGLEIYPGDAEITVYGDKDFSQAVLEVVEKKRSVIKDAYLDIFGDGAREHYESYEEGCESFNVNFPEGTTFRILDYPTATEFKKVMKDGGAEPTVSRKFKVQATIPASRQYFLVGVDETHHFISLLPRKATSVVSAHKALRPKGLSKNAKRQGEWFFEPCTEEETKKIYTKLRKGDRLYASDSIADDVTAQFGTGFENTQYVLGFITHEDDRHKTLKLGIWHKVIHNLEKENPGENVWD